MQNQLKNRGLKRKFLQKTAEKSEFQFKKHGKYRNFVKMAAENLNFVKQSCELRQMAAKNAHFA